MPSNAPCGELRVQRLARRGVLSTRTELALVSRWNELCPVGTLVRFYPVWDRWNEFRIAAVKWRASMLPSGQAVLWLAVEGCVAAAHCEPAELAHQPAAEKPMRTSRASERYQRFLAGPAEFMTFREYLASGADARSGPYVD